MQKPFTRRELDVLAAEPEPGDPPGRLVLAGACHPDAGAVVVYERGVLTLTCAVCETFVTAVAVR